MHPAGDPILHDIELRTRGKRDVHGFVVMSEHEIIHVALRGLLHRKLPQRLHLAPEMVDGVPLAAPQRPVPRQAVGHPGVQRGEAPLQHAVVVRPHHQAVVPGRAAQHIAVAQAEILARQLHVIGLVETVHPQGFEVGIGPDVVVAGAEPDLHTFVHQVLKGRQYAPAGA